MPTPYQPDPQRYSTGTYTRCGRSGLLLPRISLGLWHNFGADSARESQRALLRRAFDLGVTHFDLANNYGPPPGAAEENFGQLLREDFSAYRDELIISTKAGYGMWPGPYGEWGSRKYLLASLDQSLRRMGLEYVDIFYSHRFDPNTPLEETAGALAQAVRSGKALYAGISSYPAAETRRMHTLLREMGVALLIHQPKYNLLDRWVEPELLPTLAELGVGCIPFSPLAQGLLTNRYLDGIPADSRAASATGFLRPHDLTPERLGLVRSLNQLALARGCTLAQLAVLWLLRRNEVTTVLVGASRVGQLEELLASLSCVPLSPDELARIELVLRTPGH